MVLMAMGDPKELQARRLFRKLEVRERFREMMQAIVGATLSREDRELQRLQEYLLDWSRHQKHKGLGLGLARMDVLQSPQSKDAGDLLASSDGWAMSVVDACVDDLCRLPGGMDLRSALRVKYLNEGVSREAGRQIRVFRSGRLASMSMIEVDELAGKAEKSLIPMVKRKGLPL